MVQLKVAKQQLKTAKQQLTTAMIKLKAEEQRLLAVVSKWENVDRSKAATALKALGNKIRGDPARKRVLLKKLADLADNDADADVIAISKAALAEVAA